MIFWYTDNNISKTISRAFESNGIKTDHIDNFTPQPSIFYGILRGCGNAMNVCKYTSHDYYYIDNGYTDAEYIDRSGLKNTIEGTYRIVKNDMLEKYDGEGIPIMPSHIIKSCLLIPPSKYTAYFYNTTPEDFMLDIAKRYPKLDYTIRKKTADVDIESDILKHDCVIAFNSMAIMKAIEMGKPVLDIKGITRGKEILRYNYKKVIEYFKDKQFKLEDLGGEWKFA